MIPYHLLRSQSSATLRTNSIPRLVSVWIQDISCLSVCLFQPDDVFRQTECSILTHPRLQRQSQQQPQLSQMRPKMFSNYDHWPMCAHKPTSNRTAPSHHPSSRNCKQYRRLEPKWLRCARLCTRSEAFPFMLILQNVEQIEDASLFLGSLAISTSPSRMEASNLR